MSFCVILCYAGFDSSVFVLQGFSQNVPPLMAANCRSACLCINQGAVNLPFKRRGSRAGNYFCISNCADKEKEKHRAWTEITCSLLLSPGYPSVPLSPTGLLYSIRTLISGNCFLIYIFFWEISFMSFYWFWLNKLYQGFSSFRQLVGKCKTTNANHFKWKIHLQFIRYTLN